MPSSRRASNSWSLVRPRIALARRFVVVDFAGLGGKGGPDVFGRHQHIHQLAVERHGL